MISQGGAWRLAGSTTAGTTAICGQGPSIYMDAAFHRPWIEGIAGGTVTGAASTAPPAREVTVDIVHTWRGDLAVSLVAPDGTVYPLISPPAGDGDDGIRGVFTVDASSEAANGVWRLRVTDRAAQDIGYINSWGLRGFPRA